MELEKRVIHKNKTPKTAFAQMVSEEDYNLPEYKPDILSIIKSRGVVEIEEIQAEEDHIILSGKMMFDVLYQGEGVGTCIDVLKGNMPFRERINVPDLQPTDHVMVSCDVEDLGVVVINSRKLSLRGLTDVRVRVNGSEDVELPVGGEYSKEYQVKKKETNVLKLLEQKRDRIRFKQEMSLPKEKDTMEKVLWHDVHLEQALMRQSGDSIEMSANLCVFVLYMSEKDELVWYDTTIPVLDRVSVDIPGQNGFYQAKQLSVQTSLEPREDLDGEMRNLVAECFVELEISVWEEESLELLEDVYSMTKDLHLHRHRSEMWHLAMKNEAQIPIELSQSLTGNREAMYLCSCQGYVHLTDVKIVEGNIVVSGVCDTEILYLTTEEDIPLACAKFSIPFTGEMEAGKVKEGDDLDVDVSLYRMQCSLVDTNTVSIRGDISVSLMAFYKEDMQVPDYMDEEPLNLDELQQQPGMMGYVVKEGDELWDIAKRFHTTRDELIETNRLTTEVILPGQKLLVIKHIYL